MASVTIIEFGGTEHEVEIEAGKSLMQIAVDNSIPGIDADCGGACACGTCHVIVDPQWSGEVGLSGANEEEMLAMNPEREPTSRLSCQMVASEAWDGLIVRTPEFQL